MKIDREHFLSAVLALSLGGLVACGGEEPPAAEAAPDETAGAEEMMGEEPGGEATDEATEGAEPAAEEGADEGAGDEGAAE